MTVLCFLSPIFSYFCLFVAAFNPCQGSEPRKKYMKTWPNASKSSRRDCSVDQKTEIEDEQERSYSPTAMYIFFFHTSSKMSVNTHITSGTRETFAFSIRDVLLCFRISVLFCHAKIDKENIVSGLSAGLADQKVVWLNITVNEVVIVNGLNTSKLYKMGHLRRISMKIDKFSVIM